MEYDSHFLFMYYSKLNVHIQLRKNIIQLLYKIKSAYSAEKNFIQLGDYFKNCIIASYKYLSAGISVVNLIIIILKKF